ncbi:Ca2+-transporting ATPase [Fonsecaea multimorphosa]|nr:Ca2+-transporting ATPase [Fonsecaea multimorphosa]
MNNPGLKKPISNAANQVKRSYGRRGPRVNGAKKTGHEESDQPKQDRKLNQKLVWWYAGTAFPLLAGALGPMANAFSICALVEQWRVTIPPGGTEEHGKNVPDPKWLLVLNCCALASALIANLFLLLNMARRVRFNLGQAVTILGFWMASIMHIVPVSIVSRTSRVHNQALSQAYYYAIFGAAIYQIISYLLCVNVWGAFKKHYKRQFRLTGPQRTLMIQTVVFVAYDWLGALVYANLEGWKFLDAIYWSNLTILTIGLGDLYVPSSTLGRALLFPYALGGVISVGLVVGSVRALMLDRGTAKMRARLTEKIRLKAMNQISNSASQRSVTCQLLGSLGMSRPISSALVHDKENDEPRRMAEFNAMRAVQKSAHRRRKCAAIFISTGIVTFLWTIGAVVFWKTERRQKWTYFESLYFSYTTLMTIGYGDFRPESNSGKPFFVLWSLLAVPSLTILISNMGDTAVKWLKDLTVWVGEVTLRPRKGNSGLKRLKRNMRKWQRPVAEQHRKLEDPEKGSLCDQSQNLKQVHPGLISSDNLTTSERERKYESVLVNPMSQATKLYGRQPPHGETGAALSRHALVTDTSSQNPVVSVFCFHKSRGCMLT